MHIFLFKIIYSPENCTVKN